MQDPQRQSTLPPAVQPQGTSIPAGDASALVAQAEMLAQEGHFEKALVSLDTAIAIAPDALPAWRAKASALLHLSRVEDALEVLDAALARVGEEPSLLLSKAQFHRVKGDFARAREAFDRLITIDPQSVEGWLGKGWTLLAEGNAEEALNCAERTIMIDERQIAGHALRGDSLLRLARWTEAFAAFADAAKRNPRQFDASDWAARGDGFLEGEQPDLALRAYERAILEDPRNPEGWHGKGLVLNLRHDFEGAVAAFARASAVDKQFIAGFLNAGVLCSGSGNFDRALRFFECAKKARPDDPRPWNRIGEVHALLGRYDEARAAYEHATTIDPGNAETWNELGNVLFHLGRLDEASRSYERAIEVDPKYGWAHYNLSWVRFNQRRFGEAMQAISRAIELEPDDGVFWVLKLEILDQTEPIDQAEIDANADRALQAIGSDADLRISVVHFLTDNDRLDRGRDVLHGFDPSALKDEGSRLNFAECLLKVGDNLAAVNLLRSIDPNQLRGYTPVTWSFLRLLADRLAGAQRLSEELLVNLLRELGQRVDQIDAMNLQWTFKGVRRLLARSELPALDKLALATLIDVQEAKVRYDNLSFFTEIWSGSRAAEAKPDLVSPQPQLLRG